jgi:pectate lyase
MNYTMSSKLAFALLAFLFLLTNVSSMNVIDRCWRRQRNWAANRQRLAVCSVGFAGKMRGNRGAGVRFYTVTNPSDDPVRPWPGTLRYGATLLRGKVWITFRKDMVITLKRPLYVKSFTTIDGRGANVQIAYGSGIVLQGVCTLLTCIFQYTNWNVLRLNEISSRMFCYI